MFEPTLQASTARALFWHPPATSFAVLNQQF